MATTYSASPHLVVCAHGLEGASNDLRQVRIFLQAALPKSDLHFLMSDAYMEDTYQDIKEMGRYGPVLINLRFLKLTVSQIQEFQLSTKHIL